MTISEKFSSHDPELIYRVTTDGNKAMDNVYRDLLRREETIHRRIAHSAAITDELFHATIPQGFKTLEPPRSVDEFVRSMKDKTRADHLKKDSRIAQAATVRPFATIRDGIIAFLLHEDTTLDVIGTPYSGEWTSAQNDGGFATAHANKLDGTFDFIQGTSGGGVSSGAGLWVQFTPRPPLPRMIQVRAFCPYLYQWHNSSSNGYTAHTNGSFGILTLSFDSQGHDQRVEQDFRYSIWSDGTGWFEDHMNPSFDDLDDDHAFIYPNLPGYFQAHPNRLYTSCFWCSGSNDAGSGAFGNAFSDSMIKAQLGFVVIGQQ